MDVKKLVAFLRFTARFSAHWSWAAHLCDLFGAYPVRLSHGLGIAEQRKNPLPDRMTQIPAHPSKMTSTDEQWRDVAKGMMKAELKRQNLTYDGLAQRLVEMGLEETETSVRNKIGRGTFSFVFALQAMAAIGVRLRMSRTQHQFELELPPELLNQPKL
ncbi:MAG: DUF6471 domain-containing protein [Brevundimonas sp.]|uniref:DUF6471 domain-containing protein n=1 Tax=Brevundimonas sp. TaxID=1871086 RepID=UPI00391DAC30